MTRIFRSYNKRGINTVRSIIATYAPKKENLMEPYIRFVSERLNVSPDKPLEIEKVMFALIKAITTYEQGASFADHYSDSTIETGMAWA